MTKKMFRNIVLSIFIVLLFIGCFFGVRYITNKNDMIDVGIDVYFKEVKTSLMKSERHEIKGETNEDIVISVLEELKLGPRDEALVGIIPEEV